MLAPLANVTEHWPSVFRRCTSLLRLFLWHRETKESFIYEFPLFVSGRSTIIGIGRERVSGTEISPPPSGLVRLCSPGTPWVLLYVCCYGNEASAHFNENDISIHDWAWLCRLLLSFQLKKAIVNSLGSKIVERLQLFVNNERRGIILLNMFITLLLNVLGLSPTMKSNHTPSLNLATKMFTIVRMLYQCQVWNHNLQQPLRSWITSQCYYGFRY